MSISVGGVEHLKNQTSPKSFQEVNTLEKDKIFVGKNDFYALNKVYVTSKTGKEKILTVGDTDWHAIKRVENKIRLEVLNKINYFEKTFYPKWTQAIKDYVMSNIDRKLMLKDQKKEFMTNEKTPIIRSLVDKVIVGLFSGNYTLKVYPVKKSNKDFSLPIQQMIEWSFSASKTRKTILDASTDAVLIGVGFYRSFFQAPDFEKLADSMITEKEFEAEAVYPGTEYVSPFSVFGDPTRSFYEQPIIFRDIYPINAVLKKKKELINLSSDQIAIILNNPQRFSDKNYKKIRLIKYHEDEICNSMLNYSMSNFNNYYKLDDRDQNVEYVEYWSKDNLIICLNGYIVYDGPNPLPTKNHPFKFINYSRTPGMWISDGLGILLAGTQKLYDALLNMMYDIAKLHSGPMYILKSNQHIEGVGQYLQYDPYKIQKVRGDVNFELMTVPKGDSTQFKVMNDILELGRLLVSPTIYNELQGVSRSATDADYRWASLKDINRQLSDSINDSFNSLVNDWLLFAQKWMPEKFRIFVVGEKGKQTYPLIKRDYLMANYVIETEFDSVRDVNKAIERDNILKLLNILPSISKDPIDNRVLVDMEKLFKEVTELFIKGSDFYLEEEDFYKKLEESNIKMQEIQKVIAEQQKQAQEGMNEVKQEQGIPLEEDDLLAMQAME